MDLLDKFGNIMDEFLEENEIIMQIKMPKGTIEPEIKDNMGEKLGPVVWLYIVLNTLPMIFDKLTKDVGDIDAEGFLDSIWDMLKAEVMERRGAECQEKKR